jgi:hypothetical protein
MNWLTTKLNPGDPEWSWAVEQLRPEADKGDDLWRDEPTPPGLNAEVIGIAVVCEGQSIRSIITGIH